MGYCANSGASAMGLHEGARARVVVGLRGRYRRGGSIERGDPRCNKWTWAALEVHRAGGGVDHPGHEGESSKPRIPSSRPATRHVRPPSILRRRPQTLRQWHCTSPCAADGLKLLLASCSGSVFLPPRTPSSLLAEMLDVIADGCVASCKGHGSEASMHPHPYRDFVCFRQPCSSGRPARRTS